LHDSGAYVWYPPDCDLPEHTHTCARPCMVTATPTMETGDYNRAHSRIPLSRGNRICTSSVPRQEVSRPTRPLVLVCCLIGNLLQPETQLKIVFNFDGLHERRRFSPARQACYPCSKKSHTRQTRRIRVKSQAREQYHHCSH
jgi:hypothetical protein